MLVDFPAMTHAVEMGSHKGDNAKNKEASG